MDGDRILAGTPAVVKEVVLTQSLWMTLLPGVGSSESAPWLLFRACLMLHLGEKQKNSLGLGFSYKLFRPQLVC